MVGLAHRYRSWSIKPETSHLRWGLAVLLVSLPYWNIKVTLVMATAAIVLSLCRRQFLRTVPWTIGEAPTVTPIPIAALIYMAVLLAVVAVPMAEMALRGAADTRMLWAFHEDEGMMADLYGRLISAKKMDLIGWAYTYGSLHIMLATWVGRILDFLIGWDGLHTILFLRFVNLSAFLGLGLLIFILGVRVFGSATVGCAGATMVLAHQKILEIATPGNYPDIIGAALFVLAVWRIWLLAMAFKGQNLFWAVVVVALGFSVKFMGWPLGFAIMGVSALRLRQVSPRLQATAQAIVLIKVAALALAVTLATFLLVNPFYLIHAKIFFHQLSTLAALYAHFNPEGLPRVQTPGLADWWRESVAAGGEEAVALVVGLAAVAVSLLSLVRRRGLPAVAGLAIIAAHTAIWVPYVISVSSVVLFHYFLPVVPCLLLAGCYAPAWLAAAVLPRIRWLPAVAASLFAGGLLLVPLALDRWSGAAGLAPSPLGYAAREFLGMSSINKELTFLRTYRAQDGNFALDVGRWLNDNVADARSAVSNETIFYFPPFIDQLIYWNRQMTLPLLFRSMPDLLFLSDYFIDKYTAEYSPEDIAAMNTDMRKSFLASRAFYSTFKDRDQALGYQRIKVFDAPVGWYWKRLHVYRRQTTVDLDDLIVRIDGPPLMPEPNGRAILSDPAMPLDNNTYLAGQPNPPVPTTLGLPLKKPVRLSSMLIAWYSPSDRPTSCLLVGRREGRVVFTLPLAITLPDLAPYSLVATPPTEIIDRLDIVIDDYVGQRRPLIRRIGLQQASP